MGVIRESHQEGAGSENDGLVLGALFHIGVEIALRAAGRLVHGQGRGIGDLHALLPLGDGVDIQIALVGLKKSLGIRGGLKAVQRGIKLIAVQMYRVSADGGKKLRRQQVQRFIQQRVEALVVGGVRIFGNNHKVLPFSVFSFRQFLRKHARIVGPAVIQQPEGIGFLVLLPFFDGHIGGCVFELHAGLVGAQFL